MVGFSADGTWGVGVLSDGLRKNGGKWGKDVGKMDGNRADVGDALAGMMGSTSRRQ